MMDMVQRETQAPPCPRMRRPGRGLWLAIVALLLHLGGGSAAFAQADPFAWFTHLFQPNPPPGHVMKPMRPRPEVHRAAPKHSAARPKPSYRTTERPAERTSEKSGEKAAEKPAVAPSYFVAVLGDSLAQLLQQGLGEAFADRPEVAILRKAKESSGLVRDDFYDWTKAAQDLLASGEKIDFAVMMIGSNDRQTLRDANGAHEPRSPQWEEAYAHRIESIASMFREKKIPLVWVGLPVLKSERLAADAAAFNEIYREYAAKAGASYIDIWEAFADELGQYSALGPDINGQIVRMRSSDGVHFTKAGARKLAHFIEPEIRRNLDETRPRLDPEVANLPSPAADAPAPPNGEPEPEPVAPPPLVKPIAGPILPLTGPVLAPGGELATRIAPTGASGDRPKRQAGETSQQTSPLEAKPGRADDFAWPRPRP
ncbi:SGNH/GDSL hydrolase family protein [Methylocapsa aurea]|uniref:SGNH/GDSL hydrolase family protein n=1 Tax=Methylocapsa aurea TaxID=663610 RepID=UPI00068CC8C4|nr:SGNH family hydrolase [Methylocapsa aurea]